MFLELHNHPTIFAVRRSAIFQPEDGRVHESTLLHRIRPIAMRANVIHFSHVPEIVRFCCCCAGNRCARRSLPKPQSQQRVVRCQRVEAGHCFLGRGTLVEPGRMIQIIRYLMALGYEHADSL